MATTKHVSTNAGEVDLVWDGNEQVCEVARSCGRYAAALMDKYRHEQAEKHPGWRQQARLALDLLLQIPRFRWAPVPAGSASAPDPELTAVHPIEMRARGFGWETAIAEREAGKRRASRRRFFAPDGSEVPAEEAEAIEGGWHARGLECVQE